MAELFLGAILRWRGGSKGFRKKEELGGNSTEQSRNTQGRSFVGKYGIWSTCTIFCPDGPLPSSHLGFREATRPMHSLVNGTGVLCGVRAVEVCPSLLVLNDLETEITPRLPF